MTATENTAFQTGISGSLSVSQSRKYRRNRITKGFIRHSHVDRVRIQDRVLIEINTQRLIQFNGVTAACIFSGCKPI